MISKPLSRPFHRYCLALGSLLGGLLALASPALPARAAASPAQSSASPAVDFFELTGVIDPASAGSLIQEIDAAERSGSQALIIRVDSPGGLKIDVSSVVDHVAASKVPIVAWVAPRGATAAGAAAFVAAAASIAVMAPGTTIGPALPADLSLPRTGSSANAIAYLRQVAAGNGRNIEPLATGSTALTDAAAAKAGVITFQAGQLSTLFNNLQGRTVTVGGRSVQLSVAGATLRFHKMSFPARVEHAASRPAVAYMLLLLGLFGLIFELYFPGIGAAALMGGAALVLALYGMTILPTSWAALCLVVAGVVAFVPDLHTGGLGIPTAAGAVALLAGSIVLFPHAQAGLQLPWWAIAAGEAGTLLFFISIMTAALRARSARPPVGVENLVGTVGVARTDLIPDGEVTAAGNLWRARTLGAAIAEGTPVRVRSVSGLLLVVEPVEQAEPAGS
jgi:membrane-bound serine protease (ClpP class)